MESEILTVNEKISRLRKLLAQKGLSAWIVNGSDPHRSEYVCDRWQTRRWLSGFTGSAGTVVVTAQQAVIWVDSRYFIQCAEQIRGTCFEMRHLDGPDSSKPSDFLSGMKNVGIAAETLSIAAMREYKAKGVEICPCEDFIDELWVDRPSIPNGYIEVIEDEICGESSDSKMGRIREKMKQDGVNWCLLSSLDDIAWVTNRRGCDVKNTPVFLSYLLIGENDVKLFCGETYGQVFQALEGLSGTVRLDPHKVNLKLFNCIHTKVQEGSDYTVLMKACKNETELNGMRLAHIMDGVAMVNFLAHFKSCKKGEFSELSVIEELEEEREREESYLGPSFDTLAGFGEHGAVVHYRADAESDRKICKNGLLVLDSGGHYLCGTTDITRTVLIGRAAKKQKEDYTLVLKGHLALASQSFPEGTTGHQLDVLAHAPLWNQGLNYFHGTGHGVGFRLSVHEGPHNISVRYKDVPLQEGMVVSDEPGIYREGSHGVRIENLVAVVPSMKTDYGEFLTFETLTCCPYERELIEKSMLTAEEIDLIDTYHSWVFGKLKKLVDRESLKYLEEATKPL
ncbi:MAG: aminopeptidase P family protein [Sphaerochaetaceae bacterium]|nr:aminopeptidase P family protein [Sphaerochaetaceae bacterium]